MDLLLRLTIPSRLLRLKISIQSNGCQTAPVTASPVGGIHNICVSWSLLQLQKFNGSIHSAQTHMSHFDIRNSQTKQKRERKKNYCTTALISLSKSLILFPSRSLALAIVLFRISFSLGDWTNFRIIITEILLFQHHTHSLTHSHTILMNARRKNVSIVVLMYTEGKLAE